MEQSPATGKSFRFVRAFVRGETAWAREMIPPLLERNQDTCFSRPVFCGCPPVFWVSWWCPGCHDGGGGDDDDDISMLISAPPTPSFSPLTPQPPNHLKVSRIGTTKI